MGLRDNINTQNSPSIKEGDTVKQNINGNTLSKPEIELLLSLIKQSNFRGEQLEILYITVIKLQNQYLLK